MRKWVGLLLIGVMLFSSVAVAGIQGLGIGGTQDQTAGQTQLPSQQIIDYRLSQEQFNQAVSTGLTIATYSYDKSCVECAGERGVVEQIALSKDFQNQILLEEIQQAGKSSLQIESLVGKKSLDSIAQNSTLKAFCDIVVSPPLGCTLAK